MKKLLFLLILVTPVFGQNVRWDYVATTTQPTSANAVPIMAIRNAPASFYINCTALPCTTYANVYNSATGTTPCPNNAQIVQQLSSTCSPTADAQGNFGGWFTSGNYQYTIRYGATTFGPYQFSVNSGGGAGGSAEINNQIVGFVPLATDQTKLNAVSHMSESGGITTISQPLTVTGTITGNIPSNGITYPPSCATGTYVPASNTCVPTGTAANPGGSTGQTQINSGGTFSGIPGSVTDANFGWKTQGGIQYAKGWQSGAGNNGLANAVGLGQLVVADPSYTGTDKYVYNFNSFTQAPAVAQSHVIDYRGGVTVDTYRDPVTGPFFNYNAAYTLNFQNYLQQGVSTFGRPNAMMIFTNFWAPGASLGNPPVGPTNWTSGSAFAINQSTASPGIHQGIYVSHYKTGIGDNTGAYFQNYSYGGAVAPSDEGNHGVSWHGDEAVTTFKGTVLAGGGGSGATVIKITCTVDCNTNSGGPGDGRYAVDITDLRDSGNITARLNKSGSIPQTFTIDHNITPSIAIGLLTANCNAGAAPLPVGTSYNTVTCTTTLTGGTGTWTAGPALVCFDGQYHEQALITNVTGSGPYSLTMNLRHAHPANTMIAQGGPCGSFLDITANDAAASTTLHFPIDIIGAPDATHYYTAFFYLGVDNGTGAIGGFGALLVGQSFAATNLTNIGGTVYMSASSINQNVPWLAGGTLQISSASISGYNGACTNAQFQSSTGQYYCTQASSAGLGTAATANFTAGTSQYGNSAYTVWPGAEVLDVLDHSVNPPVIYNAGVMTLTTEPNNAAWANSDAVEEAHHYALRLGVYGLAIPQNKMLGASDGMAIAIGGNGACCGGNVTTASLQGFHALVLDNTGSPIGMYGYHGGIVSPPAGIALKGPFSYGLAMSSAPEAIGQTAFGVGCPISGCADPIYYYNPLTVFGNFTNGSSAGLTYRPNANSMTTFGNWVWASDFGKQTFRDSLTFAPLVAPTLATPTTSATGGNLTAATYYYTVYARNNTGFGTQSTEKSVVVAAGTTNSNILSWTRSAGATIYAVCRGTSPGTEQTGPTLNSFGPDSSLNYVDNGSNAFAGGACNTTDTTRAGIDNAAYAGLENSNGTTQTKIIAGAATTNINVTLPPVAGNLALGLTIPTGTPTLTAGTNVTSCACAASYTCTNTRGRLTIVGGTATTGTICTITFSASLTTAPFLTVGEMGATSLHGLDHGVPSATSVTVTAASTVSGATLNVDYEAQP